MRAHATLLSLCLMLPLPGACSSGAPSEPLPEPSPAEPAPAAPLAPAPRQESPEQAALKAAAARFERVELGSMELLHRRGDLWLGSQPSLEDLALLAEQGVRTVVSLRDGDEPVGFDEERAVEQARLRFESVAFDELHNLDDSVFERTRKLLGDPAAHPLLLHCASGNRVGPVWIAWRVLDEGARWEDALAEARVLGLRFLPYADKTRAYIEREQAQ